MTKYLKRLFPNFFRVLRSESISPEPRRKGLPKTGAFLNNPAYSDEENLSDTESVVSYTRKDAPAHNSHAADIHNHEKVCFKN